MVARVVVGCAHQPVRPCDFTTPGRNTWAQHRRAVLGGISAGMWPGNCWQPTNPRLSGTRGAGPGWLCRYLWHRNHIAVTRDGSRISMQAHLVPARRRILRLRRAWREQLMAVRMAAPELRTRRQVPTAGVAKSGVTTGSGADCLRARKTSSKVAACWRARQMLLQPSPGPGLPLPPRRGSLRPQFLQCLQTARVQEPLMGRRRIVNKAAMLRKQPLATTWMCTPVPALWICTALHRGASCLAPAATVRWR